MGIRVYSFNELASSYLFDNCGSLSESLRKEKELKKRSGYSPNSRYPRTK